MDDDDDDVGARMSLGVPLVEYYELRSGFHKEWDDASQPIHFYVNLGWWVYG